MSLGTEELRPRAVSWRFGRDDDRLAGFDEAARQDVRGPCAGGDPGDVLGGVCGGIDQVEALEDRDHFAARDDADIFRLGKLGKEQFGDGVAPIVGQLVARLVLERQDGEDRLDEPGGERRRLGGNDGAPDGERDGEGREGEEGQGERVGEAAEEGFSRGGAGAGCDGRGVVVVELLLEPGAELVLVGEDTRPGRAVETVNGQGHLVFPSLASAHVTT